MKKLVRSVLAGEGRPDAQVGLLLTDDATLHEMNRRWRGKDYATDVLAFPYGDDDPADPSHPADPGESYLGDVSISMDRALEQAPRFSASFEQEVGRLVIHGVLHLLGYDHHSPAEGRKMKARERLYLAGLTMGSIVGGGNAATRRPGNTARGAGGAKAAPGRPRIAAANPAKAKPAASRPRIAAAKSTERKPGRARRRSC